MNSAKSTTTNARRRDSKSSLPRSRKVRHRGVSLKLESLELRTLLSGGTSTNSPLPSNAAVGATLPVASAENLPPGLAASVKNAGTIATVIGPTTPSAAATSHIYTGQPSTFGQAPTTNSSSGSASTDPGKYTPAQQAALSALSGLMKAEPQYMVVPSNGYNGFLHDDFEGPGGVGYAPPRSRERTASATSLFLAASSGTARARQSPSPMWATTLAL